MYMHECMRGCGCVYAITSVFACVHTHTYTHIHARVLYALVTRIYISYSVSSWLLISR